MTGTGKSLTIKTWFANKIAQELKRNLTMCDVFAILKETEKAYYAMLNLDCNFKRTMWIPKSAVEEHEIGWEENENLGFHYETLKTDDYKEAENAFFAHWSDFI